MFHRAGGKSEPQRSIIAVATGVEAGSTSFTSFWPTFPRFQIKPGTFGLVGIRQMDMKFNVQS